MLWWDSVRGKIYLIFTVLMNDARFLFWHQTASHFIIYHFSIFLFFIYLQYILIRFNSQWALKNSSVIGWRHSDRMRRLSLRNARDRQDKTLEDALRISPTTTGKCISESADIIGREAIGAQLPLATEWTRSVSR